MNFKISILSAFIYLTCYGAANAQKQMTLKECIETGIEKNFDVEQRRIAEESEKINYKQAKLNLLPDLNGGAGYSVTQGRSIDPFSNTPVTQSFNSSSYSLSSGIVLFNGLSRLNTVKQADLSWQASQMELQQQKDNLTISITLAYLQVLSLGEQYDIVKEQSTLSQKQVDRLEVLNNEGAIKPSDLSDLKGEYADNQLSITDTYNSYESARLSLFRLMNIEYDSSIVFEKINPESFIAPQQQSNEVVYQTALQQLALVKAVDLRTQSYLKAVKVAKGGLWPTLSLSGNLYTQYSSVAMQSALQSSAFGASENYVTVNGEQVPVFEKQNVYAQSRIPFNDQLNNNLNSSLGLNLQIPLFNALQQRNKIKQAKLDVKQSEITAANTKRQLQQDIDQASLNLRTALEKYKTLLEQVNAYKQSFDAAESRFTAGVGTSIDYLIAKNNLDRANRNLITARYDYVLRNKILDFYKGTSPW